jgi:hypothetical protein
VLPQRNNLPGYLGGLVTAAVALVAGLVAFRRRGEPPPAPPPEPAPVPVGADPFDFPPATAASEPPPARRRRLRRRR